VECDNYKLTELEYTGTYNNQKCKKCDDTKSELDSNGKCLKCIKGWTLNGKGDACECKNYINKKDGSCQTCQEINPGCTKCSGIYGKCEKCDTRKGDLDSNNKCVTCNSKNGWTLNTKKDECICLKTINKRDSWKC